MNIFLAKKKAYSYYFLAKIKFIARMVKWQTHYLEVVAPRGMEVQVLFRAPIFLLFFFLLSTQVNAELLLSKINDDYFLKSNNCAELKGELKSFLNLSKIYEESTGDYKVECSDQGQNLSPIIPSLMLNLLRKKSEYYGPNCWNSVLVANGLLPAIRFSNSEEVDFVYKNFCKQVTELSKISPGHVFRIFNDKKEDFHSFIYISPNFSFSKDGPESKNNYQIENTDQIFKKYGIQEDCFGLDQKISQTCFEKIEVYDCSKTKNLNFNRGKHSFLVKLVDELEIKLGYLIENYRNDKSLDKKALMIRQLLQNQKTLIFIVNEILNENIESENDKNEMIFLYLRLDSIAEQLNYF